MYVRLVWVALSGFAIGFGIGCSAPSRAGERAEREFREANHRAGLKWSGFNPWLCVPAGLILGGAILRFTGTTPFIDPFERQVCSLSLLAGVGAGWAVRRACRQRWERRHRF